MKAAPSTVLKPQYPSEIRWLPIGQISTHPRIQRLFRQARAQRLLDNWDTDKMGEIEVVPNGKPDAYWCFEGQHRHWALYRWLGQDNNQLIPCRVYGKVPDAVLAGWRVATDGQMRMVPIDRFRMLVIAGDPMAKAVKVVLENFGLRVDQQPGDGVVQSVTACLRIVSRPGGVNLLQDTIKTLHAAFGKAKEAYHAVLVTSVANMLRRYGEDIDHGRLVDALTKGPKGAVSIVSAARAVTKDLGMTAPHAAAFIVVKTYNKSRGPKLPPWDT